MLIGKEKQPTDESTLHCSMANGKGVGPLRWAKQVINHSTVGADWVKHVQTSKQQSDESTLHWTISNGYGIGPQRWAKLKGKKMK